MEWVGGSRGGWRGLGGTRDRGHGVGGSRGRWRGYVRRRWRGGYTRGRGRQLCPISAAVAKLIRQCVDEANCLIRRPAHEFGAPDRGTAFAGCEIKNQVIARGPDRPLHRSLRVAGALRVMTVSRERHAMRLRV